MKRRLLKTGWLSKALLGGALALLGTSPIMAQGPGGGGGGGPGGGGGGGGGLAGPTLGGLGGTAAGGSTPISQGGGVGGGTTGAAPSPSSTSVYGAYYSSPYAPGFGPTFKLAPVNATTSSTTGTTGGIGGTGGAGGGGGGGGAGGTGGGSTGFTSTLNSTGAIQTLKTNSLNSPLYAVATSSAPTTATSVGNIPSFTTVGIRRSLPYTTVIGFKRPQRIAPATIHADLRQTFDRAPTLTNGRGIQIAVNGSTVVLKGTLPTIRERRVAEVLARMNPGVIDVRNDIVVPPAGLTEE